MLAQKDETISEAASYIRHLTKEERLKQEAEARRDFERQQRDLQIFMERTIAERDAIASERDAALKEIEHLKKLLSAK